MDDLRQTKKLLWVSLWLSEWLTDGQTRSQRSFTPKNHVFFAVFFVFGESMKLMKVSRKLLHLPPAGKQDTISTQLFYFFADFSLCTSLCSLCSVSLSLYIPCWETGYNIYQKLLFLSLHIYFFLSLSRCCSVSLSLSIPCWEAGYNIYQKLLFLCRLFFLSILCWETGCISLQTYLSNFASLWPGSWGYNPCPFL